MTELKNSIGKFNNTLDHDLSEKSENTNAEHLKRASYTNKKKRE